jgi:hypothetical protein
VCENTNGELSVILSAFPLWEFRNLEDLMQGLRDQTSFKFNSIYIIEKLLKRATIKWCSHAPNIVIS